MAKPDPRLLEPGRYPFACEIGTRFADQDLNQHINNVALAGLIEESRVRFNIAAGVAQALAGLTAMNVSLAIDFLGQAFYPQPIEGLAAVEALGRSSWTVVQLLRQDGRLVAFARSVLVCVADGAPAALPESLRSGNAAMMLG